MMCQCCGVRPVGGYQKRHHVFLGKLCVRCWRKNSEGKEPKRNKAIVGNRHGGKA